MDDERHDNTNPLMSS